MKFINRFFQTFSSLSILNYRLYWFGQLISLCGTWMQTTAQAWLVLKITDSPLALGEVTFLQFIPITIFALFGGVFADRFPKRTALVVTQILSMIQALVLTILVLTNTVQLWEIYVLAFSLGLINAFDNPTRQAFVSELVGKDYLANAVALNSAQFNAARVIGPALGGAIISLVGIGQAFLLNGISFIPVIIGLLLMRQKEFYAAPQPQHGNVFRKVGEGVAFSLKTPQILIIMITMAVVGTFGYNYNTILPLLARYVLRSGALGLGFLTSAVGIGSLLAAIIMAWFARFSQKALLYSAMIFSILLLSAGISTSNQITLILLFFMGVFGIIFTTNANTGLQLHSPPELRGRVLSLYFLLFAGTTPIGGFTVGFLAQHIGVQPMVSVMGMISIIGVAGAIAYITLHARTAGMKRRLDASLNDVAPADSHYRTS